MERLPGETLEEHLKRRVAKMRKVQAALAVYREADRLDEAYERLLDEEEHLWLGPDDEFIEYGPEAVMALYDELRKAQDACVAALTAGRFDEVRRAAAEVRRLSKRGERIFRPDSEALEAQAGLQDLVRRHTGADRAAIDR